MVGLVMEDPKIDDKDTDETREDRVLKMNIVLRRIGWLCHHHME